MDFRNQGKSNYVLTQDSFDESIRMNKRFNLFMPYYKLLSLPIFKINTKTFIELMIINILYIFQSRIGNGYHLNYMAVDVACIISIIILKIFTFLLMKGKIKGYYKENYYGFHFITKYFVIFYYGAFFRLVVNLYIDRRLIRILKSFEIIKLQFVVFMLAIMITALIFYSERIISIRDFNNASIYLGNTEKGYSTAEVQNIVIQKIKSDYFKNTKSRKNNSLIKKCQSILLDKLSFSEDKGFIYDGDNSDGSKLFQETPRHELDKTDPNYRSQDPNDLEYYNPSIRHIVQKNKENVEKEKIVPLKKRNNQQMVIKRTTNNKENISKIVNFPTKNRPS